MGETIVRAERNVEAVSRQRARVSEALSAFDAALEQGFYRRAYKILETDVADAISDLDYFMYEVAEPTRMVMYT